MDETRADAEKGPLAVLTRTRGRLKVLPLAGTVAFPGAPIPLRISDARDCALVADALDGDRVLAVGTLVSHDDSSRSHAPLRPMAGAGVIESEQRLPDGQYDLFFRATARVRLVSERQDGRKSYREFSAELLRDVIPSGGPAALAARRAALEACLFQLSNVLPSGSKARWLARMASRIASPSALADIVAAATLSHPLRRLAALEQLDVAKRLDLVTGEIASFVDMLSQGPSPSA